MKIYNKILPPTPAEIDESFGSNASTKIRTMSTLVDVDGAYFAVAETQTG